MDYEINSACVQFSYKCYSYAETNAETKDIIKQRCKNFNYRNLLNFFKKYVPFKHLYQ